VSIPNGFLTLAASNTNLAPWDENVYFDFVKESYFAPTNIGTFQVADANPRRVGILFANTNSTQYCVSTNPNLRSDGTQGIPVNLNQFPVAFLQKEWGIMVMQAWFAAFPVMSANALTVIELIMKDWPRGQSQIAQMQATIDRLRSGAGGQRGRPNRGGGNPSNGPAVPGWPKFSTGEV